MKLPRVKTVSHSQPTDQLLDPTNREIAHRLRAGEEFVVPESVTLRLPWSATQLKAIHAGLSSWLKRDEIHDLTKLLFHEPSAIYHPTVFWQLQHLSHLLRQIDENELVDLQESGGSYDDTQPVLPAGTKQTARDFLAALVTAWVGGILPGYSVEPVKIGKRRGRSVKWDVKDKVFMLSEFGTLSEWLNAIEGAGPAELAPKKGESRAKFLKRMETVVQRLHQHTPEYFFAAQKTSAIMDKPPVMKKKPPRLSEATVSTIVRQSVRGKRLSKNALLYGILAHHYRKDCRKIETIRGLIEHAEADFPELDVRRQAKTG